MSANQPDSIRFYLTRSRMLSLTLHGLHSAAALACWLNDLPLYWRLACFLGVCLSWRRCLADNTADNPYLVYTPNKNWSVYDGKQQHHDMLILPSSLINPYLSILHFKNRRQRQTVLIFKDAMSQADYRRMIVTIKTTR